MQEISLLDFYKAKRAIAAHVVQTPLRRSSKLSMTYGTDVYLKLENLQQTGSFKVRGAANRLLNLTPAERKMGVITVSTGNHGKAVAQVGQRLGIRVVVCVPVQVLAHKVNAIRASGAEIIVTGNSQEEAEAFALQYSEREGLVPVSPFDDRDVIAGNGTIGLEIVEDLPDVGMVLAPLSGGGMLGGIAYACKASNAAITMCGVSMERGPAMIRSIRAGRPVAVEEEETVADSLVGSIGDDNQYTFDLVRTYVDQLVTVSEDAIKNAMRFAFKEEKVVIEGGGAVALAAVLTRQVRLSRGPVAIVLSGANVDMHLVAQLLG